MPFSYEHAFRYETSLCSLREDEKLSAPRVAQDEASEPRTTLGARLVSRCAMALLRTAS
jgi:hypothetical protein